MMNKYPYSELENTKSWNVVDQAINDLILNGDLEEKTSRKYIVGYIVQCITNNDILKNK